jgi:hypothetical protein
MYAISKPCIKIWKSLVSLCLISVFTKIIVKKWTDFFVFEKVLSFFDYTKKCCRLGQFFFSVNLPLDVSCLVLLQKIEIKINFCLNMQSLKSHPSKVHQVTHAKYLHTQNMQTWWCYTLTNSTIVFNVQRKITMQVISMQTLPLNSSLVLVGCAHCYWNKLVVKQWLVLLLTFETRKH